MHHAFVNGKLLAADAPALTLADRGFRFGDGLFETLRLESGVPCHWEYHRERLEAGVSALRLAPPRWDIRESAHELLRATGLRDGFLRIALTRGEGSAGYLPTAQDSTLAIEVLPPAPPPQPQRLWVSTYTRLTPESFPSYAKTAQGLSSTLALLEAQERGYSNALMLSVRGHVSECANANLFWVREGRIYTPALSTGCIAGVTRRRLMALAEVAEVEAPLAELERAEGIALSNTRLGLHPVAALGERGFAPSPALEALGDALAREGAQHIAAQAEHWR